MTNLRNRTFIDKVICSFNSIKYSLYERSTLLLVRKLFDNPEFYNDIEKTPLVSVYMPTYNRGQLVVDRPLPSILNQTYENFEFIILDIFIFIHSWCIILIFHFNLSIPSSKVYLSLDFY